MKHDIYCILLTLALLLAMGCASSEPEATEPDAEPILLTSGPGLRYEALGFSRAGEPGTTVNAEAPETAGVFGVVKGYLYPIFPDQIVYNRNGAKYTEVKSALDAELPAGFDWPSTNNWVYAPLRYWSGSDYQFYCYAPHSSIENTSVNLTATLYNGMKEFQISGIPPYSSYDYTVARQYVFQKGGVVPFTMRHVSARFRLNMKIGENYSKIRKIKVTKVTVNDRTTGGYYHNCVVSLNDDATLNTMVTAPSSPYLPAVSNPEIFIIPIFESTDGLLLAPDEYQEFGSLYVMPQDVTSLTINVTYDVYDFDSDEPIRPAQQARNTVTFSNPVAGINYLTAESGKYYDIDIVVSPAYLYVLSDNDEKPHILITPD